MRRFTSLEARIDAAAHRVLDALPANGAAGGLVEFVVFGLKQAWACLFGGAMLLLIIATRFLWPDDAVLARYDFLFLAAVAIQISMLAARLETLEEAKVIVIFHLVGTVMEVFKTAVGSWAYPEEAFFRVAGVPLFSGFMYAAVGSYIARISRIFDMRYTGYPRRGWTIALAVAIYVNFFWHHFLPDLRLLLFTATAALFLPTVVHYRVFRFRHRMPLLLGFLLVAAFIWLAENIGTWSRAWVYPSQAQGWAPVSLGKLGAWYLLMIISFVLVSLVHRPRRPDGHASAVPLLRPAAAAQAQEERVVDGAAVQELTSGFRVDEVFLPWGTLVGDVAAQLGAGREGPETGGFQRLVIPCRAILGLPAVSVELTAPGPLRPVTSLCYQLVARADPLPPDALRWSSALTGLFGLPERQPSYDISSHPHPPSRMVYNAHWKLGDAAVSLSVYGGLREVEGGNAAACLWLSWSEDLAAAPFLAAWRRRSEELANAARGVASISIFSTREDIFPRYADPAAPREPGRADRRRALQAPDILATPASIAEKLGPRRFAVWSNGAEGLWCLSTKWDSIAFPVGAEVRIDRYETQPAKGPGSSMLAIGPFWIRDWLSSKEVAAAAAELAGIPGVTVNLIEGYDC